MLEVSLNGLDAIGPTPSGLGSPFAFPGKESWGRPCLSQYIRVREGINRADSVILLLKISSNLIIISVYQA